MPEPVTPLEVAPCGCRFGTVDDKFIFEPCSMGCPLLAYVRAEGARQGKPTTTIDMR